ncbi:MAG: GTP cyclohydrolase II [Proteobacteria bacterium]|nr:GTP cyclohydrolase II [Pseudomonadota bacterium]
MPSKPSRKAVKRKSAPPKERVRNRVPNTGSSIVAKVGKAVEVFRRGGVVVIRGTDGPVAALAVETAGDKTIAAMGARKNLRLVLTHGRARTLKIRLYTPDVVALALEKDVRAENLRAIADPTSDLAAPMKGPFEAQRESLPSAMRAGVKLAKLAGLLPAVLASSKVAKGAFAIAASDIENYEAETARSLALVTRARVPLQGAENAELVAFRPADGGPEHYAVVINAPRPSEPVLTRLHSECFTGDLLDSLKCDCGAQLRGAIEVISKNGGGVLLYLAQEGRGIGLINKLRAYRLQDQGFDTIQANERLGFEADERLYAVAARMLVLLGYKSVRLLTNNPDKVKALEAAGVHVSARVAHKFPDNIHNRAYLKTKAEKAGHLL